MSQFTKMLVGSALMTAVGFATAQTATSPSTMPPQPMNTAPAPTGSSAPMDASGATATGGTTATGQSTMSDPAAKSSDPYVQKRDADAAAKAEYKDKKKVAKEEYKQERAAAKSDMKTEKKQSKSDRKAAIAADPSKAAKPGDPNYSGN